MTAKDMRMHRASQNTYPARPRPHAQPYPHRPASTSASTSDVPRRRSPRRWQRIGFGILLLTVSAATVAGLVISGVPEMLLWPGTSSRGDATAAENEAPVFLARATLMTLHDANLTGNYGVFRALAAPDFQALNSTDALARIFSGLRRENVDLSVAAVAPPRWDTGSGVTTDGLYRIGGTFTTGRHMVRFALAYVAVEDQWRLIEISVAADPSPRPASRG